MSLLWSALLAVLALVVLGWHLRRHAAARRALCRRQLAELLAERRPELSVVAAEPGRWQLIRGGARLAEVDARAVSRAAGGGGADRRRRLFLALADAAEHGPRPLAGELDLKSHGANTLPRLADPGLDLLADEPRPARYTAADAAGLATIYVVDGAPQPVYVTEDQLQGAGIDARDLHGVALAVLRQRFDERPVRAAVDGGETVTLAPPDGCGGSRLLLLSEALGAGETLYAAAPAADRLLVDADRERLAEALVRAGEPARPLPPAVFRVTSGGLALES